MVAVEYLASFLVAAAVFYAAGSMDGALKWIIALLVGCAMAAAGTVLQFLAARRSGKSKDDAWRSISEQWGVEEARGMVTDRWLPNH